ncbi:MAG: cyclase family protein [Actinomycetes bacterium]
MGMDSVPSLGELLKDSPKNWGVWGPDDECGALNYLTSELVIAGARTVRQGKVFTLQLPMGHAHGDPLWPGREPMARTVSLDESSWTSGDGPDFPGGLHYADDTICTNTQGSTQYDALGHVWHDGLIYNGYSADTTIGGLSRASVAAIADRGVVGRGVLLDMARYFGVDFLGPGATFNHHDLLSAAEAQGVTIRERDILLIRTGWLEFWYQTTPDEFYGNFLEPGLTYSPELVTWFAEMQIPNLVTDTMGNEVTIDPVSGVALPLHNALMRNLGIAFGEMCRLGELASDCVADGQWDFLYVAAPLHLLQGAGAPVNPVAIK